MKKSFILFVFLLCSIVVVAQKKSITGIITDTAGEAVIGASIVEVGTTNGTVSDVDGILHSRFLIMPVYRFHS